MIERFPEPARQVIRLADEESDRLRHGYIGCEHVLAAPARHPTRPAADLLARYGFDIETVRGELDRLVDDGVLPPPWRNDAALLAGLGVDLDAVRATMEQTFGVDAVDRATRKASRRTGWAPLCGKSLWFKRALSLAHEHRVALGQPAIGPDHILLGVLQDAQDALDRPRCFRNPWIRRKLNAIGLPHQGSSPVRRIVEARGGTVAELEDAAAAQLYATSHSS